MCPVANIYPNKNLVGWYICLLKITIPGDHSFCYAFSPPTLRSLTSQSHKKDVLTTAYHHSCALYVKVSDHVSDHRGSNSQVIDFEGVEIFPIFMVKIENSEKSNT